MPHKVPKLKSRLETRKSDANFVSMTAEFLLEKNLRFDRSGKPLEVIIPYEQFIEFFEINGYDLSERDKTELREATADSDAGNHDAFVSFEDIQKEFGCTR